MTDAPLSWTCPHCDRTSHNPNDVEYHYCGACHHFCDDVVMAVKLAALSKKYGRRSER